MRKAYSIIVTFIALGLLGYILFSSSPEKAPTRASSAPVSTYAPSTRYSAKVYSPTRATSKNSYIINRKTKKFHVPSCSSVRQMNESNKLPYTGTRQELISKGYSPCQRCNPK